MDGKACLRALTLELRHELEGSYDREGAWKPGDLEVRLASIGVRRDRAPKPLAELSHLPPEDKQARQAADAFLASRAEAGLGAGDAVVELVRASAYTWANRLLALRAMEARGLIDEVILQKDAYGGRSLQHHRLTKKDPARCSGPDEGIFAVLFDEFGRRAGELESLFDPAAPEVALRPSVAAIKRCLELLSGSVAPRGQDKATDEVFTAPDALGWAYQYWNSEEKERVFTAAAGKGPDRKKHKIEGADIVPATCFYTDSYMVSFLVQNSLGALWAGMEPGSKLVAGWDYYVRDADRAPVTKKPVSEITLLDPACGSGHFLIEAFDLFYAMYVEEGAITGAAEICASILEHNLYGIDIDQRAVQLAGLSLVMKAKEKAPDFAPRRINLVATNIRLPGAKGHLEAFLKKHPEDEALRPALVAVFEALAHADELGSLLQVEEPVDRALRELESKSKASKSWPGQMTLIQGAAKAKQGELPLGVVSYEAWKGRTLERLRDHFEAEARVPDLGQALFGQAATKGISMVEVLSRRYDVVAANPPYMGLKNMGTFIKKYLTKHYETSKRDLFAAFLVRCTGLAAHRGLVAAVAQQSWMFLPAYANLRLLSEEKRKKLSPGCFRGLLRETSIEVLAHLGSGAFTSLSGEAVSCVLTVFRATPPSSAHRITSLRLVGAAGPNEKSAALRRVEQSARLLYRPRQETFLTLPKSPICYWLSERLFDLLRGRTLGNISTFTDGSAVRSIFVRFFWEVNNTSRWISYTKGGGYGRWCGLEHYVFDWNPHGGLKFRTWILSRYPADKLTLLVKDHSRKNQWATWSDTSGGSIGCRVVERGTLIGHKGPAASSEEVSAASLAGIMNLRFVTAMARALNPSLSFTYRDMMRVPLPQTPHFAQWSKTIDTISTAAVSLKRNLISQNPIERCFERTAIDQRIDRKKISYTDETISIAAMLHTTEALLEHSAAAYYRLSSSDLADIFGETGAPAGWHPAIDGYHHLPSLPSDSSACLDTIRSQLEGAVEKTTLSTTTITAIKSRLRGLYEAGLAGMTTDDESSAEDDDAVEDADDEDEEDGGGSNSLVRIPTETFLEELSQKLEIHPISVYWLLRELREKDGVVCLPELRRFVEDHFSVLILRLLGHQWPKQIEAREPLPSWADADGVVPLVEGAGEDTLLARLQDRIGEDFGAERVSAIEQEFQEIMGKPLAAWIASDFFKRHVSQFKKRPIAWQIESHPTAPASKAKGKGKSKAAGGATRGTPAFSCLVYYHRVDADLLPKLRTQYVGPLQQRMQTEHDRLERIAKRDADQDARRAALQIQIEELKDFDRRLGSVVESAFSSAALDAIAAEESIDAWTSRDGTAPPPATGDAFLAQERHYDPDINDGVRVNVAPLQKAGLLAAEVIAAKDLDKAIADRADWRADERRWCREGKLLRPGWWTMLPHDDA